MKANEVVDLLRRRCDEAGSQKAWAIAHGLSPAYVSDVLAGRREPADAIARALGLRREVLFVPEAGDTKRKPS